jgi:putative membrane protein
VLVTPVGYAHVGLPLEPHDLATAWSWEPAVLLGLVLAGWGYWRGVRLLWRRAGRGRGVALWRVTAFGGGMLALVVALVSPLAALGTALLTAHMAQHMLLALVAAPLLVLGSAPTALLWALDESGRRRLGGWWRRSGALRAGWRGVSSPVVVWALHAAALWGWHLPGLYQAALADVAVHAAEHASFFGTALLFWWVVLRTGHGRLNPGLGVLFLFTTMLQGSALGALMTFTRTVWYPAYESSAPAWGLRALDDQQLAGLIMWIPGGLVYLAAALALLAPLLVGGERTRVSRQPLGRGL